jgi:hypothetical protein
LVTSFDDATLDAQITDAFHRFPPATTVTSVVPARRE